MKREAVEKTCVDVGQEVVHRYRRVVGSEFQTQRALAGFDLDLGFGGFALRIDHEEECYDCAAVACHHAITVCSLVGSSHAARERCVLTKFNIFWT